MASCSWVLAGWRIIATFFYIFSPIRISCKPIYLFVPRMKVGISKTKKGLALDGPLSEVWLSLSCLHLGKHLDVRQFLHSQTGDDSAYLARSWPNLHVDTGAASHECPSISASCRDSFLCCLFLWMTPWSSCREPDRGMRAGKGN